MLDNWLEKSKLENFVKKFVRKIFFNRISPNQMTLCGLIFGLLTALFIFLSSFPQYQLIFFILSIIFIIISFVFDAFDGALARLDKPSIFGGILDMFCDRTVEVSIIIALISTDANLLMWPGIFSLGAIILCITMFLVVGGAVNAENLKEAQKVIYYRKGLMERSETFLFLLFIIIFIAIRWILFWLFSLFIFITAFLRLYDAYKIFNSPNLT
ncbi:MAG: CDP-alcohol phosphatidyltransferase family protein [Promethearchaeota archaeon]|nr:MAG: CDP-alcohol phosphatidyltransferase family protein [Candidatus Lokiarchaeota archaeon]